jgi:Tol biopolymer transport system component
VAKYDAESKVAEQLAKISNKERLRFRWGPSARNIYLDGEVNGVRNIWKISVNPSTLRFVSMERLTTGPGPDTDLAISQDGKRLAYAARVQQVRVWLYPLDSEIGRLVGEGRPVTPAGVDAWEGEISRDGTRLAYTAIRSGKPELWEESLPDGSSTLLVRGDNYPHGPRWSPDAKHVAFTASKGDRYQPVAMPQGGGSSEAITSGAFHGAFFDWSPDGQSFISDRVVEEKDGVTEHSVLLLPLSAAPLAETQAKVITSSRTDYIDEIRFSPNGRWLAFEGVKGGSGTAGGGANATLYVVAVAGGTWVPITDGGFWDDKPRWSADGKLIYMLSTRSGFLNLWAIRFDPEQGHPTGQPFQVTTFESPGRMIADNLDLSSMSLSSNLLALSMMETSGSIWTLDDVDK